MSDIMLGFVNYGSPWRYLSGGGVGGVGGVQGTTLACLEVEINHFLPVRTLFPQQIWIVNHIFTTFSPHFQIAHSKLYRILQKSSWGQTFNMLSAVLSKAAICKCDFCHPNLNNLLISLFLCTEFKKKCCTKSHF